MLLEIVFYQLSLHPLVQSSWHIKCTIVGGQRLPRERDSLIISASKAGVSSLERNARRCTRSSDDSTVQTGSWTDKAEDLPALGARDSRQTGEGEKGFLSPEPRKACRVLIKALSGFGDHFHISVSIFFPLEFKTQHLGRNHPCRKSHFSLSDSLSAWNLPSFKAARHLGYISLKFDKPYESAPPKKALINMQARYPNTDTHMHVPHFSCTRGVSTDLWCPTDPELLALLQGFWYFSNKWWGLWWEGRSKATYSQELWALPQGKGTDNSICEGVIYPQQGVICGAPILCKMTLELASSPLWSNFCFHAVSKQPRVKSLTLPCWRHLGAMRWAGQGIRMQRSRLQV